MPLPVAIKICGEMSKQRMVRINQNSHGCRIAAEPDGAPEDGFERPLQCAGQGPSKMGRESPSFLSGQSCVGRDVPCSRNDEVRSRLGVEFGRIDPDIPMISDRRSGHGDGNGELIGHAHSVERYAEGSQPAEPSGRSVCRRQGSVSDHDAGAACCDPLGYHSI